MGLTFFSTKKLSLRVTQFPGFLFFRSGYIPLISLIIDMKNEERAKYFLVDIFKNSRFNQAIEENKNLVIDCYKLVSYDRFFMLELYYS